MACSVFWVDEEKKRSKQFETGLNVMTDVILCISCLLREEFIIKKEMM